MTMQYPTEILDRDDLAEHPRNYREHPEDQLTHIQESLRTHGFYKNIIISEDDHILAGHGVSKATRTLEGELDDEIEAAEETGDEALADKLRLVHTGHVPAVRVPYPHDHPTALKLLTGDNELRNIGLQNDRQLTDLLDEIAESDEEDLLGTGFDEQRKNTLEMVNQTDDEVTDFDPDEHWTGMPEYDEGGVRYKLAINFRSQADRTEFIEQVEDLDVNDDDRATLSTWYPPKDINDLQSVKFEPDGSPHPDDLGSDPEDDDVLDDAAEPILKG